jgi:hypothetical protein
MIDIPGTRLQIPASGTMHAILVDLAKSSWGVVPRPVKWRSELEAVPRAPGSKFIITSLWEQHGLLWRDSRVPEGQAPLGGPAAAARRADALARASNESYTLTPRGVAAAFYLTFHAERISALALEAKNDCEAPPSPLKRPRWDEEAPELPPARQQPEDRMPYGKNWTISKKAYTEHVEIASGRVWLQQYWAARDVLSRFDGP